LQNEKVHISHERPFLSGVINPTQRTQKMISEPQIIDTESHIAAVIQLTIPRSKMMEVFGPAVGELLKELSAQGVDPIGAVFAHHLKMSPDTFDFELGIKVSRPIASAGRVKPGTLPAAHVARTIYHGPYEGLPGAWGEFTKWMEDRSLDQAENLWELYSVGPQSSPDSSTWRTELTRPLTGRRSRSPQP
jgi:effector-binding domain-containing protein